MAKTVLIVEDERAIVEILKFNLKREGYETLEALAGVVLDLLAQPPHRHIDRAHIPVIVIVPYPLHQILARACSLRRRRTRI